jgi:hypothetical protein
VATLELRASALPRNQPAVQRLETDMRLQVTASKQLVDWAEKLTPLIATAQLVEIIPEMIVIPNQSAVNYLKR